MACCGGNQSCLSNISCFGGLHVDRSVLCHDISGWECEITCSVHFADNPFKKGNGLYYIHVQLKWVT